MANIGAYAQKQVLDWMFGGAAVTQPSSRLIALSIGTPTSVSGSEVGTNSGYARQTMSAGAAASPAGSVSNNVAATFGPFSSIQTIQGAMIYDTISISSGNLFWYGTLLTARTVLANDQVVIGVGSLIATLS